jgi:hypothetical protein
VCFSLLDRLAAAGTGRGREGGRGIVCAALWAGSRVADTHLCAPVVAAPGRGSPGHGAAEGDGSAVGACRRAVGTPPYPPLISSRKTWRISSQNGACLLPGACKRSYRGGRGETGGGSGREVRCGAEDLTARKACHCPSLSTGHRGTAAAAAATSRGFSSFLSFTEFNKAHTTGRPHRTCRCHLTTCVALRGHKHSQPDTREREREACLLLSHLPRIFHSPQWIGTSECRRTCAQQYVPGFDLALYYPGKKKKVRVRG